MKKLAATSLLITVLFPILLNGQAIYVNEEDQALQRKADEYLMASAALYRFNGTILIARHRKIVLQKAYGWKDKEAGTLNDENTIYQVGSNTKPFTATLILKLQEEGKLSVQDKISRYLPDYPHGDKITIEQLLTNTSGIVNFTETKKWNSYDEAEASRPFSKKEIMNFFKDEPLQFRPGKKYQYSNSGFFLLGCIIEKITGMPYEHYLRKAILQPLGMCHSGFDFIHLNDRNKATGYIHLNDKLSRKAIIVDSTIVFASGELYSTIGDMYTWGEAIRRKNILKAETWNAAFTHGKGSYGYGWMVNDFFVHKGIGHCGSTYGFGSLLLYFPGEDIMVIALTNVSENGYDVTRDIAAILFGQSYGIPKEHHTIKLSESVLKQYVGVYELDKSHSMIITLENGQLQIESKSNKIRKSPIFPEEENVFYWKITELLFQFQKNKDGSVEALSIVANEKKFVWKKNSKK